MLLKRLVTKKCVIINIPFYNKNKDLLREILIQLPIGIQIEIDRIKMDINNILLPALELARKTTRKMKENLIWGAGYNVVAIPLAVGIFAPMGIIITPAVGAVLMSVSTVIVAINAMLLKLDK